MTAELVNLNTYRNAKMEAEKKKKIAENFMRFSQEKADQRRREYEEARMQVQIDKHSSDDNHRSDK